MLVSLFFLKWWKCVCTNLKGTLAHADYAGVKIFLKFQLLNRVNSIWNFFLEFFGPLQKISDKARLRGLNSKTNIVGECSCHDASFDTWTAVIHGGSLWFKNEPRGRTAVHHNLLYSKDLVFNSDSEYGTHRYLKCTSTWKNQILEKFQNFEFVYQRLRNNA